MNLGGETGKAEGLGVSQVDDADFGRAKAREALGVDQGLRYGAAGTQQAPELLDEGADRLLGEVARARIGEVESAIRAGVENQGETSAA